MIRSVFKSGNSLVVALPGQLLEELHLKEGSEVDISLGEEGRSIEIVPAGGNLISQDFSRKVDEFIEMYRPALEALSQR
jgi:antitoxin component of MazEF toxin-antitoxin module